MSRSRTTPETPQQSPARRERFSFRKLAPRAPRGTIEDAVRAVFAPHLHKPGGGRFWHRWRGTLRLLRPLGRVSLGNEIEVFGDGDATYDAIWAELAAARRRVLVSTYILEPDDVGRRTMGELVRAAQRGCQVVLVYDSFGSPRIGQLAAELTQAGGKTLEYNPMLRLSSRLSRLVRNHQKIIVVDDRVAFCGGMNISVDYAGKRYGSNLFRDTQLRLRGPGAQDLGVLVEHLIHELGIPAGITAAPPKPLPDGALVQILESNVRRQRQAIQNALRISVRRAVARCYLTSPYFVPPRHVLRDLQRAAARGVDVRVLTAGKSDVPAVNLASQHLYGRLLRSGVRVFEMQERVLHAKTVAIDGVYGSVGSFNLDHWSYRRNLEVNVSFLDAKVVREIEQDFQEDLTRAREVDYAKWTRRTIWQRAIHWIAYQLMRL